MVARTPRASRARPTDASLMASNGGRAALDGKHDALRHTGPEPSFQSRFGGVPAVLLSQLSLSQLALWVRGTQHAYSFRTNGET